MKNKHHHLIIQIAVLIAFLYMISCGSANVTKGEKLNIDTLKTNTTLEGYNIEFTFNKGKAHNYPLMALWLEDTTGNYIRTLYVAESIAKGIFNYGEVANGKWKPGPLRRPATLPYWAHKRGVKAEDGLYIPSQDNPMPDAVTGATPINDFIIYTNTGDIADDMFKVLFEINQSWDWNEYWTNNKYPDNDDYFSSCQPALVYETIITPGKDQQSYPMQLIGHSHYSGENGKLYKDLSTITTAREIADTIIIYIK